MTEFHAHFIQPETEDDGPLDVIPFPTLDPVALQGLAGKIVDGVMPYTEAHPAAVLVQLLARFGAAVDRDAHVWADNRAHPARIYPLIVGKTSDGAKGTGNGVVTALFSALDGRCRLFPCASYPDCPAVKASSRTSATRRRTPRERSPITAWTTSGY
ncbi:MAG: hypothetical protein ACRDRU_14425 [Pseudonocardiaceae bacterium]